MDLGIKKYLDILLEKEQKKLEESSKIRQERVQNLICGEVAEVREDKELILLTRYLSEEKKIILARIVANMGKRTTFTT